MNDVKLVIPKFKVKITAHVEPPPEKPKEEEQPQEKEIGRKHDQTCDLQGHAGPQR